MHDSPTSPAALARHWSLDPEVDFLNHGSFGACPVPVLEAQRRYRDRLERQPMRFFNDEMEPLLDAARAALGELIGADPFDIAFVPNATYGVNTVVRSLTFEKGDELLTTNHAYNACRNALQYVADRVGARVVVADIPFPIQSPRQAIDAVLAKATDRTKLALIDHITSPTALVLPLKRIVDALQGRGIDVLVDGAHGPGMVPLDLKAIGAAYYTGNCHKWLCTPKGSGFLHVRRDRQDAIRPLAISHGYNAKRTNRPRFLLEFDWPGTLDPTPWLAIPDAVEFLRGLRPGGIEAHMAANRRLALDARTMLNDRFNPGRPLPCPDEMIGCIASIPLPDDPGPPPDADRQNRLSPAAAIQDQLLRRHRIQTVIPVWPAHPKRFVRVSAQAYNTLDQYRRLADAMEPLLR